MSKKILHFISLRSEKQCDRVLQGGGSALLLALKKAKPFFLMSCQNTCHTDDEMTLALKSINK